MGILRTILALAVIVYHSYTIFGLRMCGGQVAVESFYMISGFYMALILNEKYIGLGSYKKFIVSRFYRIFPVYWIILLAAVLLSIIGYLAFDHPYYLGRYISNNQCLSGITILYFILENILVIGQDVFYFLKMDEFCKPELTYNVLSYKHTAYQYLFVPQAWSISIECMFYMIAPFIVTKPIKWQILIVIIGLGIRYIYAHYYYYSFDPWTYRFFPFELPLFIAGSLAYQFYKYIQNKNISSMFGYAHLCICIVLIFIFNEIIIEQKIKTVLFYLFLIIGLPFIFLSFKNNTYDRSIGELSFSLYISHHLVVSVLRGYFFANVHYMEYYGYSVIIVSIILAVLLQFTIIKRIENYRQKIFL